MAGCIYCNYYFGTATKNVNADMRVETSAGSVHVSCLAYHVIDLGLDRAFGKMSARSRRVIKSRLKLPTPASDRRDKIVRYREVAAVSRDTGLHSPDISPRTKRLIENLQRRKSLVGRERDKVDDVVKMLDQARDVLGDINP
jgi:hypothetical protein